MLAIGLQGSPQKNGSTALLLRTFMQQLAEKGFETHSVPVAAKNIKPCRGCGYCEKKGRCAIADDDMSAEIFPLLRRATVVVSATPIFFYGYTAQLKALIDRCQTFWSRKYRFGLADPLKHRRRGFLLALGGSAGKQLFDGVSLVTTYFFDAVDAAFSGRLTYRNIETPADLKAMPDFEQDVAQAVERLIEPLRRPRKILFLGTHNDSLSPMAAAFAHKLGGSTVDADSGGITPAAKRHPAMVDVMAEIGVDVAFGQPRSAAAALTDQTPDVIVALSPEAVGGLETNVETVQWRIRRPVGGAMDEMRSARDEIQAMVDNYLNRQGENRGQS